MRAAWTFLIGMVDTICRTGVAEANYSDTVFVKLEALARDTLLASGWLKGRLAKNHNGLNSIN